MVEMIWIAVHRGEVLGAFEFLADAYEVLDRQVQEVDEKEMKSDFPYDVYSAFRDKVEGKLYAGEGGYKFKCSFGGSLEISLTAVEIEHEARKPRKKVKIRKR